jgi:hypothetical protein
MIPSVQNCVMVKRVQFEDDSSLDENAVGDAWPAWDNLKKGVKAKKISSLTPIKPVPRAVPLTRLF